MALVGSGWLRCVLDGSGWLWVIPLFSNTDCGYKVGNNSETTFEVKKHSG